MNNAAQCVAPRERDIPAALSMLNGNLASLEERIQRLNDRLIPLLLGEDCKAMAGGETLRRAMSSVAETVEGYSDRVHLLETQIERILSELQI